MITEFLTQSEDTSIICKTAVMTFADYFQTNTMINQANEIERFFEALGLRIKLWRVNTRWHGYKAYELQVLPGNTIFPERVEKLIEYYFSVSQMKQEDRFIVTVEHFSRDGHDVTGICRRCGCTQSDACYDELTGSCWWVQEDLCSACATKEELQQVRLEFSKKNKGE
ncbi:MAG TPA: hypothetical protein VHA56_16285 [Mucilaginibacter sp.]|nr:hypothetical protein [Mucilaginibacter sp.]